MKVALIWPKGFDTNYVLPISLAYLKSNVDSKKHDVRIFDCALNGIAASDERLTEFLLQFEPDVVGVSCWSPTYLEAIEILKAAKSAIPNVVTAIGGPHVTSYPEATMKLGVVDFLFRGEGEMAFPLFLDELHKHQEKQIPDWKIVPGLVYRTDFGVAKNEPERRDNLDTIKRPDYDAIELKQYIKQGYRYYSTHKKNAPLWVTRGCPYRCGFCSAPTQNGRPIRAHSVDYMVAWVKDLYENRGIRYFNIIDDNFTYHLPYAKEFCRAMIALGLKDLRFATPNGIRIQRTDRELLGLMRQAGWESLCVAPESGSLNTLKRMKKDLDPEIVPGKVQEIKDAGLQVRGFFIIGYPGETIADIKDTVKLIRKCNFDFAVLNNFQPLPGTPIYDELVKTGEIEDGLLPKNYSNGERVYVPEGLKGFNFSRFIISEYLWLAVRKPRVIPYIIQTMHYRMIASKIIDNIQSCFMSIMNPLRITKAEKFK